MLADGYALAYATAVALAVVLLVAGMLPWIVWNAGHSWASLDMPAYGDKSTSLRLLASPFLPMMLGNLYIPS